MSKKYTIEITLVEKDEREAYRQAIAEASELYDDEEYQKPYITRTKLVGVELVSENFGRYLSWAYHFEVLCD